MPIKLRLEEAAIASYMRIATSPLYTLIQDIWRIPNWEYVRENWRHFPKLQTLLERLRDRCYMRLGRKTMKDIEKRIPHPTAL
jgi:hypothetical protein